MAIDAAKMKPDVLEMYKVAKSIGIPSDGVAAVIGIQRSTLYLWYGGGQPSYGYREQIQKFIRIARFALEHNFLPTTPQELNAKWAEAVDCYANRPSRNVK